MNPFLHILYAALGTLGFCMFFNLPRKYFLPAACNGAAAWAVYLLLEHFGSPIFLCAFGGSFAAALSAEILARKLKTPSLLFYIAGIIPLVPGSSLYYMMEAMVRSDYSLAGEKAFALIWTILGIGAGCALVIGCMDIYHRAKGNKK